MGVRRVFAEHFTPARLQQLESSVLAHLRLSTDELSAWECDAEQFYHEQEMAGGVCDNVRSCAEALHCALLSAYQEELGGFVMTLFQQACAQCPPAAVEAAQQEEAIAPSDDAKNASPAEFHAPHACSPSRTLVGALF